MLIANASTLMGQRAAHKFIDHAKQKDGAVAMTIPGWLIRTGIRIATGTDDSELDEMEGLRDIVKGIKQLRFVLVEDTNDEVPQSAVDKLIRLSIEVDGMEEYVRVRDKDTRVTVMVKQHKDRITNLLILSDDGDELAVVNVKTKISLTELEAAAFSFNQERKAHN